MFVKQFCIEKLSEIPQFWLISQDFTTWIHTFLQRQRFCENMEKLYKLHKLFITHLSYIKQRQTIKSCFMCA